MSTVVSTYDARPYRHAADIPKDVWDALFQKEAAANVILPFALKAREFPRGGKKDVQLWIVLSNHANNVEFILSCTKGDLGDYPIFIVACKSPAQLPQDLTNAVLPLVKCLLSEVPPQRVFSVFALADVAKKFAEIFVECVPAEHGILAHKDPYYDATLTFCSSKTFKTSSQSVSPMPESDDEPVIKLRPADTIHFNAIKSLCKEFSETSPPFVLDDEKAELEANMVIKNQQAWVHVIQEADTEPEVACLVAATRESDNVTAITKVYTPNRWRQRGCAVRLLHRICKDLTEKNKLVVLYVGNSAELLPARKTYDKIGFQGLGSQGQEVEGVEKWLEIGFDGTVLGHW